MSQSDDPFSYAPSLGLIPPAPPGTPTEDTVSRLETYLSKRNEGVKFNDTLQGLNSFHNPRILSKIVELFHIQEHGSMYPKELYDPGGFNSSDYCGNIADAQQRKAKKQKEQQTPIVAKTKSEILSNVYKILQNKKFGF